MDNTEEVLQSLMTGMIVATFLLNTSRVLNAIGVFKECLILLNNKALNNGKEFFKIVGIPIYVEIFKGYDLISDHAGAIECGKKLQALFCECGNKDQEGMVKLKVAQLYQRQRQYKEATKKRSAS